MLVNIDFELRQCLRCGMHYQVPTAYMDEYRKESKQWFHCPAGYARHFTEAERLRRERDCLKQRLAEKDDEIAAERRKCQGRTRN